MIVFLHAPNVDAGDTFAGGGGQGVSAVSYGRFMGGRAWSGCSPRAPRARNRLEGALHIAFQESHFADQFGMRLEDGAKYQDETEAVAAPAR